MDPSKCSTKSTCRKATYAGPQVPPVSWRGAAMLQLRQYQCSRHMINAKTPREANLIKDSFFHCIDNPDIELDYDTSWQFVSLRKIRKIKQTVNTIYPFHLPLVRNLKVHYSENYSRTS
jgi:hypothetical protein